MPEQKFSFHLDGVAHLIKDRLLSVPTYQRSYAWKSSQLGEVSDFWDDLKTALDQDNPEYFLGTIVLSREGVEGRWTIIDGQQRLATTAILLSAIRNEFQRRGDAKRARMVEESLVYGDVDTAEYISRLQLNSEDDGFFEKLIIRGDDSAEAGNVSNKLIADANAFLQEKVRETADSVGDEWSKRLSKWTEFITNNVETVVVDVPTEADAFMIFETLNDRGADLTIADLLKNFLFGRAGARLNAVRDGWMVALGALEISAENNVFVTFLRHYWSSHHGAVRERDLYKSIKERVTNEREAVEFVDDLKREARLYAALMNSENEFWQAGGTGLKKNVETILRLNLEQIRPLFLAVMKHFPPDELKKVLGAAIAWSVRGIIVGGIGGGTYEKRYCEAAVKVRQGEIKSEEELFTELSSMIPTDGQFLAAFAETQVTKSNLARYYLSALEKCERNEEEPELIPNEDEEKVNLEHVLPKSPTDADWPQFSTDDKKDYVNRLGNMALLQKGPNGRIGNKAFDIKKPILTGSDLLLTKQAGAEIDWTPTVITNRQARLAELAVRVWPRA